MKKQNNWDRYKAIGNITENIVEFLINSTPNWKCFKYGIENHIEELKRYLKDNNQDTISRKIRSMPDFIAINSNTKQILLIEVKFKSFIDKTEPQKVLYNFGDGKMKGYLDFWDNTNLVIVHNYPPYFFVINLKDVAWHKHFHKRTKRDNQFEEQWNFAGIQKGIRDILPELPEEALQIAINMIPKY